jgi:hypothetical protein
MAVPASPIDGELYTTSLGVVYQYVAADDKWILCDQQVQGYTGVFNVHLSRRPGMQVDLTMPYDVQLDSWRLLSTGGTTGMMFVNLYTDTYANYPFTGTTMHSGATGPNISGWKNEDNDITDWSDRTIAMDDILRIEVASITGIRDSTLALRYHKT